VFVPSTCFIEEAEERPAPAPWPPDVERVTAPFVMAALRLLVDPPNVRVFVDGAEAGTADDFDGPFQRLTLPGGCHDVSLVLDGYRTRVLRVDAIPGRTLKLEREMHRGRGTDFEDLAGGTCGEDPPAGPGPQGLDLPVEGHDFDLTRQGWFLAHGRLTAVVGLAHGRLAAGGRHSASLLTHLEARRESGAVLVSEHASRAPIGPDGAFVSSYRIDLAPGRYALRLSVRDLETGQVSATTEAVDVPDLHKDAMSIPSVLVLESMQKAPVDPMDPLREIVLGDALPVPRFGSTFKTADAPIVLFQFSRPEGAAPVLSSYVILGPDGTAVSHDSRLCSDQVPVAAGRSVGAAAFGPIRLAGYRPGRYRVVATVTELDTLKSYAQQTAFEIEAEDRTAGR
jgi:hypothetical protein